MTNLLSANFMRLRKSRLFWTGTALALALTLFVTWQYVLSSAEYESYSDAWRFEDFFFVLAPFMGIFFTTVIVFFLGTEYSDGAVRNKIAAGHTRAAVYAANLITCIFISTVISAVWLIGGLAGLPFTECGADLGTMLTCALIAVLFNISMSAIVVFIGMITASKAGSAAISVTLFFGMDIVCSFMILRLSEPETVQYMELTAEGMQLVGPVENNQYISGAMRVIFECIVNALPWGQAIMLSNMEIVHPVFNIVTSAFLTIIISAAGVMIFNKKNLK